MGKSTPMGRNFDSRTRLLNSLGLFQEQQQRDEVRYLGRASISRKDGRDGSPAINGINGGEEKKRPRHSRSKSDIPVRSAPHSTVRSALHNTVAFQTSLNDENVVRSPKSGHHRRSTFTGKINTSTDNDINNTASVRFNTVVSGIKIPSRNQYSRRIKQTLWRDRYELSEMVERNTTEFHAENYDWNQVVLDDEMYVDATSGERVHPCHVEGISFDEDDDDDGCDDSFGDSPCFSPLSRSDSILGSSKASS